MNKNKQLISVYGTLRKGGYNHRIIEKAKYIGSFESKPIFTMYSINDAFPALKLGGNNSIVIEVYEIDNTTLKKVDGLEGYNPQGKTNLYDRKKIFTPYGESYIYIYEGNIGNSKVIESGDWEDYEITNQLNGLMSY